MLTFCNLCKNCLSWRRQGKRKQDKIEANNNATLKRIASVAGAKRGGGGGEEKSAKREGRACYKSQCFFIAPTNFHTNPMTTCQLSIHDQSQVSRGGFLAWSKLNITLFTRTSKTFLMKEWNKVNFLARWNRCENKIFSMSRAWDKEKIWVPDRIRTHDLPNTGRALYPLELRTDSRRARPYTWFIFTVLAPSANTTNNDHVVSCEY